ncbi:MAG: hypothetical protein ACR2IE_14520, partial [Candidatus Sumerlaeaceae bacterium]
MLFLYISRRGQEHHVPIHIDPNVAQLWERSGFNPTRTTSRIAQQSLEMAWFFIRAWHAMQPVHSRDFSHSLFPQFSVCGLGQSPCR